MRKDLLICCSLLLALLDNEILQASEAYVMAGVWHICRSSADCGMTYLMWLLSSEQGYCGYVKTCFPDAVCGDTNPICSLTLLQDI